ncbi:MAG: HAD family phosphatase [Bacteroidia bacterium]|jgi:putative hydrolase of the HAD superfamily|nr:HAD family phosphatase [Bacteroidia bacterium]
MIRNLIFDLGGVILNLDFQATADAFRALGMTNFDELYTQAKQTGIFDEFDKGHISPAQFRTELRKHLPPHTSDQAIDHAWNAMLLNLPPERLELLRELRGKYKLYLLSNTNEIHVEAFSAYLQHTFGFADFTGYFDQWYYSCRMGMRKPDEEIFLKVLNDHRLNASETIFIDDSKQHVEGAARTGIHAIWLEPGQTVFSLREQGVY